MLCNLTQLVAANLRSPSLKFARLITTLTPQQVTHVLSGNEALINQDHLPDSIKYIECNQLASNSPIEDRVRVSSLQLPGFSQPTIIAGVFDGHGGGVTADIISRRLFNYIAIALHPQPHNLKLYDIDKVRKKVVDLYASPPPERSDFFQAIEANELLSFKNSLKDNIDVTESLRASFKRCDDDLSQEIQQSLLYPRAHRSVLEYYLYTAVSGCCAIVMIIHDGVCYVASSGDCKAVLGEFGRIEYSNDRPPQRHDKKLQTNFKIEDLNVEHNCDNINEIRRLASSHPKSEQNTIIKHNRLLGNLMPFRAFGDFNYKWTVEMMKNCGLTKAFGLQVVPTNYRSPPYLIVDPEIKALELGPTKKDDQDSNNRYIVIASDGLWELYESSRDVIQAIAEHENLIEANDTLVDKNAATHIMRSALRSGSHFEHRSTDAEELQKKYHLRLQSILTLSKDVVRNFRDDISIIVLKLK